MEFANSVSELITKLIERHDQEVEWHTVMEEGLFGTIKGEKKNKLKDWFSLHSFNADPFNFFDVDKNSGSSTMPSSDPIKKLDLDIGGFKGIGTFCSYSSSSENDSMSGDSSSSSSGSSLSSDTSSSSSDSSMSSDSSSSSSESSSFAPSKELYHLSSTKQLLKQFENEERQNEVNLIIALTMILGHSNIQLQNLYLLLKEDEESQDNESGSSIDNEDRDEMSISGKDDIGLEVFEKNIDGASYPIIISIPKTVTVPVKRTLMMEFDDESLS
ncbi:predicted protein [Chaetoceros tenuissimus]|uniref:Uncharacterized protein n=1 Tax=Chaetoceros tenuissimus TaxID=426638 RepID=A0AAD3CQW0_9STRA|nr:predicted protein [Chaetoceros tenuissimus]